MDFLFWCLEDYLGRWCLVLRRCYRSSMSLRGTLGLILPLSSTLGVIVAALVLPCRKQYLVRSLLARSSLSLSQIGGVRTAYSNALEI